jgi:Transposase DDE domain group 1
LNDLTVPHTVLFPDLVEKSLVATFDQPHASADGGAVLLKAIDRRLGVIDGLADGLRDRRAPRKVTHTRRDLVAQRVFAIACGHPDGNDADRLAEDPIHKLLLDRDPIDGGRLASQPTISRFEQTATRSALYRMTETLADTVIDRHRRRCRKARRVTIDIDPTADSTHGAQPLPLLQWVLRHVVLLAVGRHADV